MVSIFLDCSFLFFTSSWAFGLFPAGAIINKAMSILPRSGHFWGFPISTNVTTIHLVFRLKTWGSSCLGLQTLVVLSVWDSFSSWSSQGWICLIIWLPNAPPSVQISSHHYLILFLTFIIFIHLSNWMKVSLEQNLLFITGVPYFSQQVLSKYAR